MLESVLNTSTNIFCQKASDVKQSWEASAKSPDRRPSPRWTGIGPVNEGIMFGKLSAFSFLFHFFNVLGVCLECVLEWMCEWMSLRCHCFFLFCFVFWTSVAWKPWCLHIFLVLSLFFLLFFFASFFSSPSCGSSGLLHWFFLLCLCLIVTRFCTCFFL